MAVAVFEGLPSMTGLDELVWYGARVCLVAMFPFSAVDKIWHWKNALAQTASDRLPGAKPMLIWRLSSSSSRLSSSWPASMIASRPLCLPASAW